MHVSGGKYISLNLFFDLLVYGFHIYIFHGFASKALLPNREKYHPWHLPVSSLAPHVQRLGRCTNQLKTMGVAMLTANISSWEWCNERLISFVGCCNWSEIALLHIPSLLLSTILLLLISFYHWTMPHPTPCHHDPRLSCVRTLANSSVLSLMAPSSLCLEVSQRCNLKTLKGKPSTIVPSASKLKLVVSGEDIQSSTFDSLSPENHADQSTLLLHASTQALFAMF